MRDYLSLFLNGKQIRIDDGDAFETLSDFLRKRNGLIGTKIVCSEGDCGACSVLLGRVRNGSIVYEAIDSCIAFMYQLDGTHVVTVEGLSGNGVTRSTYQSANNLTGVQQAMVEGHGSQCGFCTPGFVVMMSALLENRESDQPLTEKELRRGLTGNLCRCTGYVQIFESGKAVDPSTVKPMNELYPEADILPTLEQLSQDSVRLSGLSRNETREVFIPSTVEEAAEFKATQPNVRVISGSTDVGVQYNKGISDPEAAMPLYRVEDLKKIHRHNGVISIGAAATWAEIQNFIHDTVPQFSQILDWFGSPQIRHMGTIGGNLINASPISDSMPYLMVAEAELELAGPSGSRRVNINEFYQGYKSFDMKDDELLVRVHLPVTDETLRLYKISRRKDMDISTFTAAFVVDHDGDQINGARIAYGGCGPVVFRLPKTEQFLTGKPFTEETFVEAGKIAKTEITPITDVRGSQDFRFQLAENIPIKFFHEVAEEHAGV